MSDQNHYGPSKFATEINMEETSLVWGHYPCLQDVDKSNENNKNGARDGHKSILNTSDDDSSNINNERRCFSVFLSWTTPRNIAKT